MPYLPRRERGSSTNLQLLENPTQLLSLRRFERENALLQRVPELLPLSAMQLEDLDPLDLDRERSRSTQVPRVLVVQPLRDGGFREVNDPSTTRIVQDAFRDGREDQLPQLLPDAALIPFQRDQELELLEDLERTMALLRPGPFGLVRRIRHALCPIGTIGSGWQQDVSVGNVEL